MARFINLWSVFLFKFENLLLYFKLEQANRPQANKSCHIYIYIFIKFFKSTEVDNASKLKN